MKRMKTLRGQRGNGLSKNTLLDDRFSARRLRRSFGAPPYIRSVDRASRATVEQCLVQRPYLGLIELTSPWTYHPNTNDGRRVLIFSDRKFIITLQKGDADLIAVPGQVELHGRCRCDVLLSPCFGALFVADLTVGIEDLESHCRCRGRFNLR